MGSYRAARARERNHIYVCEAKVSSRLLIAQGFGRYKSRLKIPPKALFHVNALIASVSTDLVGLSGMIMFAFRPPCTI